MTNPTEKLVAPVTYGTTEGVTILDDIRTYAVGDIHGNLEQFERTLAFITNDAMGEKHRIVFLGDYIDRGEHGVEILRRLKAGPTEATIQEYICLMGNHEQIMLQALTSAMIPAQQNREPTEEEAATANFFLTMWVKNGGAFTLKDLHPMTPELIDLMQWVVELPTWFEDSHRYFIHGGIPEAQCNLHPSEVDDEVLMWTRRTDYNAPKFQRDKHFNRMTKFNKYLVHGHEPQKDGYPDASTCSMNLDTVGMLVKQSIACWAADHPMPMNHPILTQIDAETGLVETFPPFGMGPTDEPAPPASNSFSTSA